LLLELERRGPGAPTFARQLRISFTRAGKKKKRGEINLIRNVCAAAAHPANQGWKGEIAAKLI
jgi:hypothetical protein